MKTVGAEVVGVRVGALVAPATEGEKLGAFVAPPTEGDTLGDKEGEAVSFA